MSRRRTESRARARALQALYAWDMRGEQDLSRVAGQLWDDLLVAPEERDVAAPLLRTVVERRAEVDGLLAQLTTNWRLSRLSAIDRSVLRLAGAELLRGTTPPRVVIHEAVRLAERYGTDQSARFVNGVVDAMARHLGRL